MDVLQFPNSSRPIGFAPAIRSPEQFARAQARYRELMSCIQDGAGVTDQNVEILREAHTLRDALTEAPFIEFDGRILPRRPKFESVEVEPR